MKIYKSKIGLEIVLPLLAILGSASFLMAATGNWPGLSIVGLVVAFIVYVFATISYTVTQTTLIVKCGFLIRETIEINTITQLRETHIPISAPAASLDRLEITHAHGTTLISPNEKQAFIQHLLSMNPAIRLVLRTPVAVGNQ